MVFFFILVNCRALLLLYSLKKILILIYVTILRYQKSNGKLPLPLSRVVHWGVGGSYCLSGHRSPAFSVQSCLEGCLHWQPSPLFHVVNICHSGSTLASLSFWFALNNAFCQIKILFPTQVSKIGQFSFYHLAKKFSFCIKFFQKDN